MDTHVSIYPRYFSSWWKSILRCVRALLKLSGWTFLAKSFTMIEVSPLVLVYIISTTTICTIFLMFYIYLRSCCIGFLWIFSAYVRMRCSFRVSKNSMTSISTLPFNTIILRRCRVLVWLTMSFCNIVSTAYVIWKIVIAHLEIVLIYIAANIWLTTFILT